jgi:hypothetical protein
MPGGRTVPDPRQRSGQDQCGRRDVLLHLVPGPARIVILKGYARRYRAACSLRWGPAVNVAPQQVAAV